MNVIESKNTVAVLRWMTGHVPVRNGVQYPPVTIAEAREAAVWLAQRTAAVLRDTGHRTISPAEVEHGWPLGPLEDAPADADPDAEAIAAAEDTLVEGIVEMVEVALTTSDPAAYLMTALAGWLDHHGHDDLADQLSPHGTGTGDADEEDEDGQDPLGYDLPEGWSTYLGYDDGTSELADAAAPTIPTVHPGPLPLADPDEEATAVDGGA